MTSHRAEIARYRKAAEAALHQVDAAIDYLRRIHKRELAARLETNRRSIARRLVSRGKRGRS